MKKVIHRAFWVWDYDKEENWLDEMSRKGFQLSKVGLCRYVFEQDNSHCYRHRLEMLKSFDGDYIPFLEGTGIEYLCRFKNWAYFRKDAAQGEFQLYSDADSKIRHLNRILILLLVLLCVSLCFLVFGVALCFRAVPQEWWAVLMPLLHLCLSCLLLRGVQQLCSKLKKLKAQKLVSE